MLSRTNVQRQNYCSAVKVGPHSTFVPRWAITPPRKPRRGHVFIQQGCTWNMDPLPTIWWAKRKPLTKKAAPHLPSQPLIAMSYYPHLTPSSPIGPRYGRLGTGATPVRTPQDALISNMDLTPMPSPSHHPAAADVPPSPGPRGAGNKLRALLSRAPRLKKKKSIPTITIPNRLECYRIVRAPTLIHRTADGFFVLPDDSQPHLCNTGPSNPYVTPSPSGEDSFIAQTEDGMPFCYPASSFFKGYWPDRVASAQGPPSSSSTPSPHTDHFHHSPKTPFVPPSRDVDILDLPEDIDEGESILGHAGFLREAVDFQDLPWHHAETDRELLDGKTARLWESVRHGL